MKSILIEENLHEQLKNTSKKTGIKIKVLTETALRYYLKKIKIDNKDN